MDLEIVFDRDVFSFNETITLSIIRDFKPSKIVWLSSNHVEIFGAQLAPFFTIFKKIMNEVQSSSFNQSFILRFEIKRIQFEPEEKEQLDTFVLANKLEK